MTGRTGGATPPEAGVEKVKLWDPLLRGFHWLLAFLVISGWLLGKFGPAKMTLHFWAGYLVIGLLALRLIWGFVGPKPARFFHFIYGPRAIWNYARHMFERRPSYWPGHNPLGSLAVFALLGLLGLQAVTGLMIDPDDFINVGPLADDVSAATRKWAKSWHHTGSVLLLILVGLHVAMIGFYKRWKGENLLRPMITGWKWVRQQR